MDRDEVLAGMKGVYERHAARFDAERAKFGLERSWLERFEALTPPGGAILDVGCGAGDPVARHFVERGYAVTGLDYAAPMIDLARARFPQAQWIVGDMREIDFGARFDGVLSWHSFFHLTADDQRETLPRLAACLKPGAPLMLTVGPAAGEVFGQVAGEPVYHASLDPDEYQARLDALGLDLVAFRADDPETDGASVLLARRRTQEDQ